MLILRGNFLSALILTNLILWHNSLVHSIFLKKVCSAVKSLYQKVSQLFDCLFIKIFCVDLLYHSIHILCLLNKIFNGSEVRYRYTVVLLIPKYKYCFVKIQSVLSTRTNNLHCNLCKELLF